jgi:glycosyltransferase involved in cell wall biosynthesis
MRFCIKNVDTCVVWASIECERYAEAYGLPRNKFLFVPHHHTTKNYDYEVSDEGYLFTGGNSSRDYRLFVDAVRDIQFPCVLAATRQELLRGLDIPKHVRVIGATPQQFRQLLASCRFVVLPMQANLLRTGGQQTFLNAMLMGKPVILTDPEGGRDYIVDGETGILVPSGNVEALHKAIARLAQNPKLVRELGERAQRAAVPLTTESCNVAIWNHVVQLIRDRKPTDRQNAAGAAWRVNSC